MRVLIVEDSPDDAELLCAELARAGTAVTARRVDTEAAMREALDGEEWDIVISDHNMPCFSATEAHDTLKASGKDIPFIIYSGDISEQTAVTAMHAGVSDFVHKGNAARLVPLVQRELRNAETRIAQKSAETQLQRLSRFDTLTQLANRAQFCELGTSRAHEAIGTDATFAVAVLNLDRFREVNHAAGFAGGDDIIKQVAERLNGILAADGVLARLNGDNFGLWSGRLASAAAVEEFAGQLTGCFVTPFRAGEAELFVTCSVGIALFPGDGIDIPTLIVNAEAAVAAAKRVTGNSYRCYDVRLAENTGRRVRLEAALRHAVANDELVLHYQPIVALATERVVGAEALVRWQHPERGLLQPDAFIPLADETGIIVDLGACVLRQACRQIVAWHEKGHSDLRMSVNVSAAQFEHGNLIHLVDEALKETGAEPWALDIEITETVLMHDIDGTIATLMALKDRGVSISIDDFGTGYSSLAYLRRFPIDTLKIDRSFIRDVIGNSDGDAIVCAIVALARRLQLRVIAEGVEARAQADALRRERCDFAQGHYFGKAVPAADFLPSFGERNRPRGTDMRSVLTVAKTSVSM